MRRVLLAVLKIAVSAALLIFIYRKTPLEQIGQLLLQVDFRYLLPIAVLFCLNTALSARKWQLFLHADDIDLPLGRLIVSYMSGTFCNLFLPTNIGGDTYRIYDIARRSRQGAQSAASVFADRFSGFVALVILSFFSTLYLATRFNSPRLVLIPSLLLLIFLLTGVALAWQKPVKKLLAVTGLGRLGPVMRVVDKLFVSFARYREEKGLLLRVMLLSFFFQFLYISVIFLMARALGDDTPFIYFSGFVPIITLMEALPVSIYGIGVRDYGYVHFFTQAGMGALQSRSLALFFMAAAVCYSLIGGLFFLYNLWATQRSTDIHRDADSAG